MTGEAPHISALEAALGYAALGIPVLPLHWPTEQWACSCGCKHPKCWRRAKHPLVGIEDASTNPGVLRDWWERWPTANVGISAANLLIVDADVRAGKEPDVGELAERWRFTPGDVVTCRTASGGLHLYFRRPTVRHSKGKERLGPGLDVQSGPRGFVVAPPSRHYNFERYAWLPGRSPEDMAVPELPEALLSDLTGRPPIRWLVRVAPYWAADRLHLSVENRHFIRRLLRMR